jgi:hypothetical protein
MSDEKKAFFIEIVEGGSIYYKFFEDDFKNAEERADEFVQKGIDYSASIYDTDDLVELIRWDEDLDQIVYILTSYGKFKGYDIVKSE